MRDHTHTHTNTHTLKHTNTHTHTHTHTHIKVLQFPLVLHELTDELDVIDLR